MSELTEEERYNELTKKEVLIPVAIFVLFILVMWFVVMPYAKEHGGLFG